MIHIIKNYKWVIATSLICIIFGLLTFFTFTNQSFITLKDLNIQILLIIDLFLLLLFFGLIVNETHQQFNDAYADARKHILSGKTIKHLEKIQNV